MSQPRIPRGRASGRDAFVASYVSDLRFASALRAALLAAAALALVVSGSTATAQEPVKRALLIGIDEYQSPAIKNLRGAVNDVELMKTVLVGKFGVPSENVRTLTNEQATRAGILAAINELITAEPPADIAILHFSGHGAQMQDRSNDELDHLDETIVPYDSRMPNVFDISDDEINGLLQQLARRTPRITLIMDSCHSGSVARAADIGSTVRQAPRDERPAPPPEPFAVGSRTLESAASFRSRDADYVLISGSQADELSNETRFGNVYHGALTYHLAEALRAAGTTRLTYRDVMETVEAGVSALFPRQHPDVEGTLLDLEVFGDRQVLAEPFVLIEPGANAGMVSAAAGRLLGMRDGDELDVYPPGTRTFAPGAAIARVRLEDVGDFESTGRLIDGAQPPAHSRAKIAAVTPPDFRLAVFVDDPANAALGAEIRRQLGSYPKVELTNLRDAAELAVAFPNGSVTITNRAGDELSNVAAGSPNAATQTADRVALWARWYGILAIDNPQPDVDIDLSIRPRGADPADEAPQTVPPGTQLTLEVTNRSDADLHIIVLDLASDGSICILYPSRSRSCRARETSDRLAPDETLPITIETTLGDDQESSVDIVKVIASTTKIRPQLFEQSPIGTRGAPPARSGDSRQDFIADSVLGLTRGLQPVSVSGWVSRERVLRVVRNEARLAGFSLHFEDDEAARRALDGAAGARGCMTVGGACYDGATAEDDETTVELRAPAARGAAGQSLSPKEAFDHAYDLMDQTGAVRVEPELVVEVGAGPPETVEGARGGGGTVNDPRADDDPGWALAHVRVPEAWALVRSVTGRPAGREAEGIVVAHPDTGYRPHPEIWSDTDSVTLADAGYDYYDRDDDATDELLDERRLDNPAHGTGSASAIVSPMGCQIETATKCPTGPALGARLVPLRVGRSVVQFTPNELSRAIKDASRGDLRRMKVETDLMSISLGGPPSYALWKATKRAEERGYLIFAAAGNYVGKVVWPARFNSVIAVAATNIGCRPWEHTSHGRGVDLSAPGESVWRASIAPDDPAMHETGMGTGTTYATATAAGVGALWLARHAGTPELEALKANGTLTDTFRRLAQSTAWRPDTAGSDRACDPGTVWQPDEMGAGILDAAALLSAPLPSVAAPRAVAPEETIQDLPLWSSLYSEDETVRAVDDYRRLFRLDEDADLESVAVFEGEVLHHYTMDPDVADALDTIALDNADDDDFGAAREALLRADISNRLRAALR